MFIWSPGMTLEYLERASITQALKFYQGNKTHTAGALGCAVNTLNSKLERYEQEDRDGRARADREQRERDEFDRRQRGIAPPPGTGHPYRDPAVTAAAIANSFRDTDGAPPTPPQNGVAPGIRVEPAANTPAKPAVPVPERKEVQSVLPRPASSGGKKGGRS